jgi:UDP-N-acetyl-D-glucosamine dehydrogenase
MELAKKIKEKKIKVAIVGLGYVGLPLAMAVINKGVKVIGIDLDKKKIDSLKAAKNYIQDVDDKALAAAIKKSMLEPTSDFHKMSEADVVCITVPTPINKEKTPDLKFVEDASKSVAKNLKRGQLIILKSTTYPGTTDEVVLPILETSGLKAGKDFYLAFAPERIDPGNEKFGTANTPKVVGGIDETSTHLAGDFFRIFIDHVHEVSSTRAAEMSKILENTFRLINISFINEMALIARGMGIDIWEVIEAAKTKPFGFMPFYPGPGLGGHCIPVDPYYLSYKAKEYNLLTRFIDVSSEVDDYMQKHVVELIKVATNREPDIKVLIWGAAYKKDIDDFRESPSIKVMEILDKENINFDFYDPFVAKVVEGHFEKDGLVDISEEIIGDYDVVAILTDHTDTDYDMILRSAKKIVDTRNAIKAKHEKVLKI